MIDLELYRVFKAVTESGSFSSAAKKLFISQSAVSQSIKQLESQTGCKLFARFSKGVTPTREGEMLYEYVDSALKLLSSGEEKLFRMQELKVGSLKIGAGDTISQYYLLPILEKFHNLYPELKLEVINRTSAKAVGLLKEGAIDVALVNLPFGKEENALQIQKVQSVQDVFVAGEKFAHLKGQKLSWEELLSYPLIMLEEASASRKYVNEIFLKEGLEIKPEIELGAHSLLLEFAKIGLGISCVIKEFAAYAMEDNGLFEIELEKTLPKRSIGICTLKQVTPSLAAKKFMELCGR